MSNGGRRHDQIGQLPLQIMDKDVQSQDEYKGKKSGKSGSSSDSTRGAKEYYPKNITEYHRHE